MARKRVKKAVEPPVAPVAERAPEPQRPVVFAHARLMSRRDWQLAGLAAVIGVVAYLGALDNQFVYDDQFQILTNPTLQSLANIPRMFTESVWQFMQSNASDTVGLYYRPIFNIALIVNYHLFGTNPFGWHLVSLALHVATTIGVFMLARQWKLTTETAFVAAMLFGLHPAHCESVAWASGLPDPLAAVFLVGALLAFERRMHVVLGLALALLAMLSKEVSIVFPVFLVARGLLDEDREGGVLKAAPKAIVRALPYFALTAATLAMRYMVLGFISKAEPKAVGVPSVDVLWTIPSALLHYARTLVIPYPLAITYDVTFVASPADPRFWGSVLALAAIAALLVWLVRSSVVAQRALVWTVLFLVPVLNLKAFNPDESLVHDRYLYIPSIGFCLLVAIGIAAVAARLPEARQAWARRATTAVFVVLFGLTVYQNAVWNDDITMATHAIEFDARRPFLYNYVGAIYDRQNDLKSAEQWYGKALALRPDFMDTLSNLGDVYNRQGRYAEAQQMFTRSAEAGSPYYSTYYNLGIVSISLKQLPEARTAFARAHEIDPRNPEAVFSLGWVADQQDDRADAEQFYLEALRLKPAYAEPRINLAVLQTKEGRYDEALANLSYVQKIAPAQPVMLYALGDLYMKMGRYNDAIAPLTRLTEAQPSNVMAQQALAACRAQASAR